MTTKTTDLAAAKRFLEGLSGGANPTPVLCAVSGGMDSMCLLHLLSAWGRERNLTVTAAHFNHQLRGAESDRDESFVRRWCAEQNIPFVSGCGDVRAYATAEGRSLEEAARSLRYAFLEEQRRERNCVWILTAHHADDNAETMLLNLLRGTGLRGLAGIPEKRGCIVRPFLQITREELRDYAAAHEIPYVEDTTNALDDAARNVLRHKVLPVLRELNPRAVENMSRTAALLKQDEEALTCLAEQLAAGCCTEEHGISMDAQLCRQAEQAVLSRCIRAVLSRVSGREKDLSSVHVEAVCALVHSAPGKEVSLPYGMTARRTEEALLVCRDEDPPESVGIQVGQTVSFGRWRVSLTRCGGGRAVSLPENAALTVTAWHRDDRMHLPGSRGERSFKRLCADRGIPPAERDLLPVLRVNGRCAAVPELGIHCDFAPREDFRAVFVTFHQKDRGENA